MSEISGNKQRLLIVDDSKVIRVTARKILQNHFETVEAVDGNNAWEILNSQDPFALIVSDLTMPNLDGFGLLEKIRNCHLPHIRNIPVIIITGANDSEATMQRATAAGATDFIGKPFDSVHLLARTEAHASAFAANNSLVEENIALEDQATIDPLTGLANDTAFMDQGRAQLSYAIRHNTTLALASLEIDNFGDLVKQHDPDAGELVIKSVGSALAANIRKEDIAARTGTARFALLLPGMNVSGVSKLSERIAGDIGKHAVIVAGKRVRFTVSIGIAAPDIHPDTEFEDLLTAAGESLQQAIARGGNRVVPDAAHRTATGQDVADSDSGWTLEPLEQKAAFHAETLDGISPDVEELQIETMVAAPVLDEEPAVGFAAVTPEIEVEHQHHLDATEMEALQPEPAMHSAAEEVEETIVITSPYSLYDLDEVEIGSTTGEPESADTAETSAETVSMPAPDSAPSAVQSPVAESQDESDELDFLEPRPGLLMRLLGALFGRRDDRQHP